MKHETYQKLQLLARCTFVVGSYNKRFVHALCVLPEDGKLTPRQVVNVDRLYWRYRKQIAPLRKDGDPELVPFEEGG